MWPKKSPDLKKFFANLSKPTRDYNRLDRYRDFKAVFGTEQGQRVLDQILEYSDRKSFENDVQEPNRLIYRAGMRETGLWIVRTLHQLPEEPQ